MCTVTIQQDADAIVLTMNRDESVNRPEELSPMRAPLPDDGEWFGPRDTRSGGTWIGVNDRGAIACLLNCYDADENTGLGGSHPSRGEIVPLALAQRDARRIADWLEGTFDPAPYRPFHLIVADGSASPSYPAVWTWKGNGQWNCEELGAPWAMFTTSSWRGPEVSAWRLEQFWNWRRGNTPFIEDLPAFHLIQKPGREEWGPLVKRANTTTRSITQIRIDAVGSGTLSYWSRPTPESRAPAARLDFQIRHRPTGVG